MGGYCRIGFRRSIQTSASKNHIAGSAPNYRGHLILETQSYSRDWPSRVESVYSLLPALQSQAQNSASPLHGFGFAISPALDIASDPGKLAQSHREDIQSATLALAGASQVYESEQEIDFTGPLEDVVSRLQDWAVAAQQPVSPSSSRIHLYVCTHAARDCRCGTIGTSFYKQLQEFASRLSPQSRDKISVREISHIGGHKYAANCLAYPSGDWFGNLDPEDAPDFLRAILDLHQQRDQATRDKHIWWENWRGRLGLSAEEATSLFEKASGNTIRRRKQGRVERSLGEAVVVQFRSWDGTELSYTGFVGETIKDVARRHDLVEAICGGLQECATCHVMLEGSEESLPKLPEMSEDEEYACRLQWTCIVSADG